MTPLVLLRSLLATPALAQRQDGRRRLSTRRFPRPGRIRLGRCQRAASLWTHTSPRVPSTVTS